MTILCKSELVALNECKEIIERGLDCFIEVGNALLRVRNEKLYRMEYDTFELWCELTYGMSDRHARRMIQAAEVVENLQNGPAGPENLLISKTLPTAERQTRPLASLPPKTQVEAWNQAVETAKTPGKPTHDEVAAAVEAVAPKKTERINYKPSNGLQYAEMAISNLEKIQPNDTERDDAFDRVARWLKTNR